MPCCGKCPICQPEWDVLEEENSDLRALLRGVIESLDVIDEMKIPALKSVVHGAFMITEKKIRYALAKGEK